VVVNVNRAYGMHAARFRGAFESLIEPNRDLLGKRRSGSLAPSLLCL
jgi:hypothetical protein